MRTFLKSNIRRTDWAKFHLTKASFKVIPSNEGRMDIPVRPFCSAIVGQECPTYGLEASLWSFIER